MKNNVNFKTLLERNGISNQNVSVNYVANNTNKYIDHSLMISLPQPQSSMVPFDFIKSSLITQVTKFYETELKIDYNIDLIVSVTNYGSINIQVSILNPKYKIDKIDPTPSFFAERSVEIKTLNTEKSDLEEAIEIDAALSANKILKQWSLRISPLLIPNGKQSGWLIVLRDITEQKLAQERVEIFQRFAEASGQGFGMADLEGNITYINPAVARFTGLNNPEEGIGKQLTEFHPPEYIEQLVDEVVPFVLKHGEWTGEMPMQHRDGSTTAMILSMFLLRDDQGEPQRFAAVLTDISERKLAEAALEESEKKFRALADTTSAIILMAGEDGRIFYANKAAEEATGYVWGEPKLKPHIERLLLNARADENDRLEQLADRYLRQLRTP